MIIITTFIKKDWVTGEVITERDMDRLEYGILEANNVAQSVDIMLHAHTNDDSIHTPAILNSIIDESGAQPGGPRLLTTDDIDISGPRLLTADDLDLIDLTQSNYLATDDPVPSDDGYTVGSLWVNSLNNKAFICTDDTPNAHVWVDLTASGSTVTNIINIVSGSGSTPEIPPTITNHNDLLNIQGGTASDYFHLTSVQRAQLLAHLTDYNNPHQTTTSGGSGGYVTLDQLGYLERTQIPKSNLQNLFADTFTLATAPAASNWRGLAWSPELRMWVAVATTGASRLMTSYDGYNWNLGTPPAGTNAWADVCWSPEKRLFVAVANAAATPTKRVMTSPDGISWTLRVTPDRSWTSICWAAEKNLFVAVAKDTDNANTVMTSPDGINWTQRSASHTLYWEDVIWAPELNNGNGYFIAVGGAGDTSRAMYSTDGINWIKVTTPGGTSNQWGAVAWSPELRILVAVAYAGITRALIMTSTDGINWTMRNSVNDNRLLNVIWAREFRHFVACGDVNTETGAGSGILIKYSRDGINWYAGKTPADGYYYGMGYSSTLAQVVCVSSATSTNIIVSPNIMNYTVDGDYAKLGHFHELYNNNYPVITTKESIKSITTSYMTSVYDRVLLCSGTITVALPPAAAANGCVYTIKNIGTGVITIDAYSSETIDGTSVKTLNSQYDSCQIVCNGTLWCVI